MKVKQGNKKKKKMISSNPGQDFFFEMDPTEVIQTS